MFYRYRQNNSGGLVDFNEKRGISVNVIVEAPNLLMANAKAEDIGLYFDGEGDCECCGNRWSTPWDTDGTEEPDIKEGSYYTKWMKEKPEGFIHYLNGEVKPFRE